MRKFLFIALLLVMAFVPSFASSKNHLMPSPTLLTGCGIFNATTIVTGRTYFEGGPRGDVTVQMMADDTEHTLCQTVVSSSDPYTYGWYRFAPVYGGYYTFCFHATYGKRKLAEANFCEVIYDPGWPHELPINIFLSPVQ